MDPVSFEEVERSALVEGAVEVSSEIFLLSVAYQETPGRGPCVFVETPVQTADRTLTVIFDCGEPAIGQVTLTLPYSSQRFVPTVAVLLGASPDYSVIKRNLQLIAATRRTG